jgi:hypothetical protein
MYCVLEPMLETLRSATLSAAQLVKPLQAQVHPANGKVKH